MASSKKQTQRAPLSPPRGRMQSKKSAAAANCLILVACFFFAPQLRQYTATQARAEMKKLLGNTPGQRLNVGNVAHFVSDVDQIPSSARTVASHPRHLCRFNP